MGAPLCQPTQQQGRTQHDRPRTTTTAAAAAGNAADEVAFLRLDDQLVTAGQVVLALASYPAEFATTSTAKSTRSTSSPPRFATAISTAGSKPAHPPIRLAGHLHTLNPTTGEVLASRSTETFPDGVIYVPFGDSRASVCPACAETYRADTYHLIRAGLLGGKGVPDTVATHPVIFATFTARSRVRHCCGHTD